MSIYTNTSGIDSVRNAFMTHSQSVSDLFIATPFFSYHELFDEILNLKDEYLIRIIVRLGPSTSPNSLKKIINRKQFQIRYFTSSLFHSKLYIFGDKKILIGSANLTQAGFQSNREICIEVSHEDERFDALLKLYNSYWTQADVLTLERLNEYSDLYSNFNSNSTHKFENEIIKKFGEVCPSNEIQGGFKQSKEKIFLESYRRTYQEFESAYRVVESIYKSYQRRKQPESEVPLRIEIDQFFNFMREIYVKGDIWKTISFLEKNQQEKKIRENLDSWFLEDWSYLDNQIPDRIKLINKTLSSEQKIKNSSMDDIFQAIDVCHSIHSRLRFFDGGHDTLKKVFIKKNELKQVQNVISYLLYGQDDYVTRMGNCIFDESYAVKEFGRSAIQELLGWVNKENIPICNGRTVKVLRYLGFNVEVFN
ncbi:MAG: phospholipase D family protein [Saprospiraceae bacterium]|mgnify:CR=1 FL=1|nr:phospholipase D family protein [Saprospiraceae bacterium]